MISVHDAYKTCCYQWEHFSVFCQKSLSCVIVVPLSIFYHWVFCLIISNSSSSTSLSFVFFFLLLVTMFFLNWNHSNIFVMFYKELIVIYRLTCYFFQNFYVIITVFKVIIHGVKLYFFQVKLILIIFLPLNFLFSPRIFNAKFQDPSMMLL